MAKKFIFIIVLILTLTANVFSQKLDKHYAGSILIGGNVWGGATPNIFGVTGNSDVFSSGNYAATGSAGFHVDLYLTRLLSISSGLSYGLGVYAFLDSEVRGDNLSLKDFGKTPMMLTVPVNLRLNLPIFHWIYAGVGVNFNFPVGHFQDSQGQGNTFYGVPIDLGFDFISPGAGGMRFFLRATPEFHGDKTVVPIGLVWQIFNIRLM